MQLFGYGLVNYDDIVLVDSVIFDGKTTASTNFCQVGGPVPVALQTYTKLGGESSFYGVVGKDVQGDYIVQRLTETITCPFIEQVENASTSRSIVIIDGAGKRTIVNIPANNIDSFNVSPFAETFATGGILHLDGRDLDTGLLLAKAAKQAGMIVSIDLGTMRPGREELLSLCDIILASKSGSAGLTPNTPNDINSQLDRMRQFGAKIVGATLAEQGVIVGDELGTYTIPAFDVPNVVDTNGAGDCFHGAFLYAYAHLSQSVQEAAKFAQACVALKITSLGNDAGLPRLSDVMAYLA